MSAEINQQKGRRKYSSHPKLTPEEMKKLKRKHRVIVLSTQIKSEIAKLMKPFLEDLESIESSDENS
ncbi:MAG: hypothetical protein FWE01_02645 [Firmicutes bacterium]|nr:hypothetical protein [Bacillota bacterium]